MKKESTRKQNEQREIVTIEDPGSAYEFGYESFVRHAARPIVQTSRDGIVTLVNDRFCEVTGLDRDDLVGRHVDELLRGSGDDPMDLTDAYVAVVVRADGSAVCFSVRDARIMDARGQIAGRMKICYAA